MTIRLASPSSLPRRLWTSSGLACAVLLLAALPTRALLADSPPIPVAGRSWFVATNGNDQWSGKLPQPNADRTDGPFASLPRALSAARSQQESPGGKSVFLRAGTHFLEAPLALTSADAGLVLSAMPGELATVSGGRRLIGWKPLQSGDKTVLVHSLPEALRGQWNFRELWVNGRPATRARHPNQGYLAVESLLDKSADWTQGQSRFRFKAGDISAWPSATNGELIVMSRWVESRLPIARIDARENIATFAKRSVFELGPGDLYYVEGLRELLDAPGEWCLEPSTGMVFYLPRPGETTETLEAIAPVLSQLVRIEGTADKPVSNLTFHGLTFAHAEWYFPDGYTSGSDAVEIDPAPNPGVGGFAQAAIGVPGAVRADGLRNAVFSRCSFENLGTYGLELRRACQSNKVIECDFHTLGAGGIKIGETLVRTNAPDISRGNMISDCHIYDGGRLFHSAIGVWIGQSPDNIIQHSTIHDFYYTGISVGWTWGYGPALATNTTVQFNHVHHIGVRSDGDGPILSDMAGIYTLGLQTGSVIRSNLWHDTAGRTYGGWGIYFDEGTSGILAEKNLVYHTTHGGFHQHYGQTNCVRNNIFALARDFQVQRSRLEPHLSFTFETNIVFFNSGVLFAGNWEGDDRFRVDSNVYFDTRVPSGTTDFHLGPCSWADWLARGHDRNTVVTDPLFESLETFDFRLRPNSPALSRGFQNFDLRRVGVRPRL